MRPQLQTLAALALLAACAGTGPQAPRPAAPRPLAAASAPTLSVPQAQPPVLAGERYWLEQLFAGTPVSVGAAPEAGVRVAVPLKFAFDGGLPAVKPPLAAVLDKVAASLQRQQRAQVRVAAPTGRQGEELRTQLIRRGIAPWRIALPAARADAAELQLWVPA